MKRKPKTEDRERRRPARGAQRRRSLAWPRRFGAFALIGATAFLGFLLLAHARLESVRIGYALSQATAERQQLEAEHRKLEVEVATLMSPRRLRRMAAELGMGEPRPEQIIQVDRDRRSKVALGQ